MSRGSRDAETREHPRRLHLFWSLIVVLVAIPLTSTAQPVTVDFSVGPTGDIGPRYTDPTTGLQALGMWCNGDEATCTTSSGVWNPANLWRRNDNSGLDLGLGVCDPSEGSSCTTGTATSTPDEFNELSDRTAPEVIYLTLPPGDQWVSVTLSSLDDNSADGGGTPELGILWADVDTIPNNGNAVLVTTYTGTNNGEPFTVDIPSTFSSSPFLFFEPFDFTSSGSTNNDHLVYQVTLTSISSTTSSTATSATTSSTTSSTTLPPTTTTSSTSTTQQPATTTTTTMRVTTTTHARATTTTTTVPTRVRCCVGENDQGEDEDSDDDESEEDQSGQGGWFHFRRADNGTTCKILTPSECRAEGGTNLGRGTCAPNPCPRPQRRDSNENESD